MHTMMLNYGATYTHACIGVLARDSVGYFLYHFTLPAYCTLPVNSSSSNLVPRFPPPTGNECTKSRRERFLCIHFRWEEGAWGRGYCSRSTRKACVHMQ